MTQDVSIANSAMFQGGMAEQLLANDFDPGCLRPFLNERNQAVITRRVGYDAQNKPILRNVATNNAATLRKDDWVRIDQEVITAARPRLCFFNDLRANGLNVAIPDALGQIVYQYERQSGISEATMSMDGLRRGDADRPSYDMAQMPLPIIHKDFMFSARQVAVSRKSNVPLDVTTATMASRMVAEKVERIALGVDPQFKYGGGSVYGVCNYPYRLTKLISNPWNSDGSRNTAWTPGTLQREILESRRALADRKFYGPFAIYHSTDFDEVLDDDYNITTSGISTALTLRERLLKVNAIQSIKTSEFLPPGTIIMLEMSSTTIQAITGLDITTIQWQTEGGMEVHFKVLCMLLPHLKSDYYGRCGILHACCRPAVAP